MIFIGLGSNLPAPGYGAPREVCEAALAALAGAGVEVVRRSRWYESAPVPPSDQPWFVNGVVRVATALEPAELLALLLRIEGDFGRVRRRANEPRILDLDLLAYGARVEEGGNGPALPHPRMHERAFVLVPLAEIAPGWRHPVLGLTVEDLIARLPGDQRARPLA